MRLHLYIDNVVIASQCIGPARMAEIFSDGFESADTAEWSKVMP